MLSDKVVCAIRIIDILTKQDVASHILPGMSPREIKETLKVDSAVSRSVVAQLCRQGVLKYISRKYALCQKAREITLYDLCLYFHFGLPLGNAMESGYNKGDFHINRQYRRFRELELQMEQELSARFGRVTIFDCLYGSDKTDTD